MEKVIDSAVAHEESCDGRCLSCIIECLGFRNVALLAITFLGFTIAITTIGYNTGIFFPVRYRHVECIQEVALRPNTMLQDTGIKIVSKKWAEHNGKNVLEYFAIDRNGKEYQLGIATYGRAEWDPHMAYDISSNDSVTIIDGKQLVVLRIRSIRDFTEYDKANDKKPRAITVYLEYVIVR